MRSAQAPTGIRKPGHAAMDGPGCHHRADGRRLQRSRYGQVRWCTRGRAGRDHHADLCQRRPAPGRHYVRDAGRPGLRRAPQAPHGVLNARSVSVDQTVAADLQKGKLDLGDVGSRAWESLGVIAFRAYQDPFLISSRELLDAAVTGRVAARLLATLKPTGITGLAIAPDSIRYLYSTRPLTTPAQFSGAKIRINDSATTSEVLTALGVTPVTGIATGPPAVQALRDGTLTAIESNPENAMENGYVQVAPYVVVNAPLFAKTDTFAINSAQLARLPARDAGWLRQAAQQAAATEATSATDRTRWGSLCGQGLKPLAVTEQQLTTLQNAEAPTYADLASDPQTALAIDRIGGLATSEPRMDSWATCHGAGLATSPTRALDGSYGITLTQAEVAASGDCTDCGNAGTYGSSFRMGVTPCTTRCRSMPIRPSPACSPCSNGCLTIQSKSGPSPLPATGRRSCLR